MPKYCSVPSCKTESCIGTRSFYRFPLQEPERLQQWLRNMGRENWAPSRHQYICHQHFAASCFRVRWGIRYLESDAVPTLFHQVEKRKAEDQSEKRTNVSACTGMRTSRGQTGGRWLWTLRRWTTRWAWFTCMRSQSTRRCAVAPAWWSPAMGSSLSTQT
ncbi:unnamed protein product [Pleuronectes platessa]|uniref:THAP-type domain-containing protein n=1 Tax=Pleuronectes platessa TaxID=8262 RepID=A0A9N7VLA2_PLEPL|nr:unnamed protein product [Pleuronectes platessa]